MPEIDEQIKVPESALERAWEVATGGEIKFTNDAEGERVRREKLEKALTVAIQQLVEEVLGDEAIRVAAEEWVNPAPGTEPYEPDCYDGSQDCVTPVVKAALQHVLGGSE